MEIYPSFVSKTLTEIDSNKSNKKCLYLSWLNCKSVTCVCWSSTEMLQSRQSSASLHALPGAVTSLIPKPKASAWLFLGSHPTSVLVPTWKLFFCCFFLTLYALASVTSLASRASSRILHVVSLLK